MRLSLRLAAVGAALLASVVPVAAADAAVTASAALQRAGEAVRLEVTVSSTKAFTAATRPRSAKVGSLALKRASSTRRVVVFRSKPLDAAAAGKLSGKRAAIRLTSRRGTRTMRATVAAVPPAQTPTGPAGTAPTAPSQPVPPAPSVPSATRNDPAGQARMTDDLLLEWASFGASGRTAEYRRIWLLSDGTFRLNQIDWNDVSGEICSRSVTGTWTFKEGYTADTNGGLVLVKLGITTATGTGDELLTFANADPNAVYVGGTNPVRYERNPQIAQNC